MMMARDDAEFFERTDRISGEGDGLVRFTVCLPEDHRGIADQAAVGHFDSQLIVDSWKAFTRTLTSQPRGSRVQCPLCPRSLQPRRFAFGLAVAYGVEAPENGMMFGLCEKCAPDRDAAEAAGHRAMCNAFPGMRSLIISPTAGRA